MSAKQTFTIQFLGFSGIEKAPFISILSLSKRRPICYQENTGSSKADLQLLNLDNPEALRIVQSLQQARSEVILVGNQAPADPAWKIMPKPIRWIRLFDMLDESISESMNSSRHAGAGGSTPLQIAYSKNDGPVMGKVLVVDDNETVRKFMAQKLNPFQFHIDFSESGEEALRMARNHQYVCIFLDVIMTGIDGYQVCRLLKKDVSCRNTAVVMLTSRDSPLDRIRGKMAGCDGYLTKPVEEAKLLEAFSRFLAVQETGVPA